MEQTGRNLTDVHVVSTVEQLKALLDRKRLTILRMIASEPMTVKQIADKLGLVPASVHYHVKVLERAQLVQLVETRERLGILEKYYVAVAQDFAVDPALGHYDQAPCYVLDALISDMRIASAALAVSPDKSRIISAQLSAVKMSRDRAQIFAKRLEALIAEFRASGEHDASTVYSMALAIYPISSQSYPDPDDVGERHA